MPVWMAGLAPGGRCLLGSGRADRLNLALRMPNREIARLHSRLEAMELLHERAERAMREELARNWRKRRVWPRTSGANWAKS